jgi:hypothetical protein
MSDKTTMRAVETVLKMDDRVSEVTRMGPFAELREVFCLFILLQREKREKTGREMKREERQEMER